MTEKEIRIYCGYCKIKINYLSLSKTEIKVQHALGTALWNVSIFNGGSRSYSIIPVSASSFMSAVNIVEKLYLGSIAYQVDEVTTK
ncbi:hypothetical protein LCGC14_1942180 [marine sediment metagenome]|uniref:Uncharacterized protein n=1 Tax=marine sediment metagenome TaxID=412755 RepID=A0A0F9FJV3_9ZZZZ